MAAQKLIAVKEFCVYHGISSDFIFELQQHELIELITIKRTKYIPANKLAAIEKMIRLHTDLEINTAGIQAVLNILSALERKEAELNRLRNLLEFYVVTD